MNKFVCMLAVAACLLLASTVMAAPAMNGPTLIKEMKTIFEPARSSVKKIMLTTSDKAGSHNSWVLVQANKTFPDGKRMVMTVAKPDMLKGYTVMIEEKHNGTVPIFTYLPATRRVIEMTGIRAYDSFYGTEFNYADLGFVPVHDGYKFMVEETHQGTKAYKIEETIPEERAYYSRVITWIAVDTKLPLERDFYDRGGNLWKTELFKDVAVADGIPTPMTVIMEDKQSGGKTTMKIETVDYDVSITNELFDITRLTKADKTLDEELISAIPKKRIK